MFIDVTVWDRAAEIVLLQYLKEVGKAVHVEGYLKMDSWDDKTTGEKKSKIKVQADRVQFLDCKGYRGREAAPLMGSGRRVRRTAPRRVRPPSLRPFRRTPWEGQPSGPGPSFNSKQPQVPGRDPSSPGTPRRLRRRGRRHPILI